MNIYSVDIRIWATTYVRAKSQAEAFRIARGLTGTSIELRDDPHTNIPICGCEFDNPDLPDISLSPIITLSKPFRPSLDLVQRDID